MDLVDMIIALNPQTKIFVNTEQYKLSRELMGIRYEYSLSLECICEVLGLTFDEYANLEFGDVSIEVKEYNMYIKKLKTAIKNREEV